MPDYSTLDAALDDLGAYGPDLASGLTSHAPMVVEALAAVGRAGAVRPWIDGYRAGLVPAPVPTVAIPDDGWRALLGREDRVADWFVFFERELARASSWQALLGRWIPRLAPAACASATHGLIRTGHAARSLAERETPSRRRELAHGLGYWAAAFQTLPVVEGAADPAPSVADAVRGIPVQPPAERVFTGTIVSSLAGLDRFPAFGGVAAALPIADDLGGTLSDLTEAFAGVYVANAVDGLTTIVFVHGVTSLAAIRSLLPHVAEGTARDLVRFGWQTSAALYATFASTVPGRPVPTAPPPATDDLIDRAVACGDDHAIKFTEACLREHGLRPSPIFLAAAEHAIAMLAAA